MRHWQSLSVLTVAVAIGYYFYHGSDMTESAAAPASATTGSDWDARLEKKLEKLKDVKQDDSWFTVLPKGISITKTVPHGESFNAHSAYLVGRLPSGEEKKYFLKLGYGEYSRAMLVGEYESMKALHAVSPAFTPECLGYGTYVSDPETHFLMIDFIDMANELPDKTKLCSALADLHRRSITHPISNGQYGFQITTYNSKVPQANEWTSSWEDLYLRHMKQFFGLERDGLGPSPELDALLPAFYEKVIPRLLRPLETGGNSISPVLLHGDLWDANTAVRKADGMPLIFDSSAFWGHNECEMAMWRPQRMKIRMDYVEEYFRHYPKSEPAEDWDDRNLLYSLRPELQDSILFPSTTRFREIVIDVVRTLVEKYPEGYTGSEKRKGLE